MQLCNNSRMNDQISTTALISVARQMGIPGMTPYRKARDKLLRWARIGFLPPPIGHGAGRGKGRKESTWDASCIDRLRLIADILRRASNRDTGKSQRVARKTTERALIAAGYWVSGERIRSHLNDLCTKMGKELGKRRPSMKTTINRVDLIPSLERTIEDRMPRSAEDVKALYLMMTLGIASIDEGGGTPAARISRALSNQVMRDTIERVTDADLKRIYTDTGRFTHLGVASHLMLTQLRLFLEGNRFPWLSPLLGVGDAFAVRCAALLWGILLEKHDPELHHDIQHVIHDSMMEAVWAVARQPVNDGGLVNPRRSGGGHHTRTPPPSPPSCSYQRANFDTLTDASVIHP